ncbi:MAG: AAA family ATPase [Planctomycetota bacterium]
MVQGRPDESSTPTRVGSLSEAADALAKLLERSPDGRPIVGITGPVGSGKSTLARLVSERTGGVVVSTDRYLPDYAHIPSDDRDNPDHADLPRLRADLLELSSTGSASVPDWSFHTHRREGETRLEAAGAVFCEGLFALHEAVADLCVCRVFVEASPATRWQRWEAIERSGERGWGVERARDHFHRVAEPAFRSRAADYRRLAHLIVTNDPSEQPGSSAPGSMPN